MDDIPRHRKRAPRHKKYGITNGHYTDWYVTAKARDQAFEELRHKLTWIARMERYLSHFHTWKIDR